MCFFGTNGTGWNKNFHLQVVVVAGGGGRGRNNSEKYQEGLEALGHGENLGHGGAGASFRGMDMKVNSGMRLHLFLTSASPGVQQRSSGSVPGQSH